MTAAPQSIQPIRTIPPADLLGLADSIYKAREAYLNAFDGGQTEANAKAALERLLWNDKGTFAPALRQAAEVAALRAKVDELTRALREARAHVADTTLAAGTPAYVKCCRALMAIDDALALNSQDRGAGA